MRTFWLGSLLALTPQMLSGIAEAAPLQWQVEGASTTQPSQTAPPAPNWDTTPRNTRSLVWTLDPEPAVPAASDGTRTRPDLTSPSGQSTAEQPTAPSSATQSSSDQPNAKGYPPYGVPLQPAYPLPYIGGAVPSAYVGGWGNYWFGLSGGTPGNLRDGAVDASFNAGIGLGDFYNTLAVEVDWGIGSIKNFNANGGFSVSAGRLLVDEPRLQVAAAGGLLSFYTYGNEGNPEPTSGYGVVTFATPLRPGNYDFAQVLQLSLGAGGYQFAYLQPNTFESDGIGYFAALGMQITRNVGLSFGWSSRGSNVNLSYTPFRHLPVYLNVVAADVFATTPAGTVAVFSISWGDDFRTALF